MRVSPLTAIALLLAVHAAEAGTLSSAITAGQAATVGNADIHTLPQPGGSLPTATPASLPPMSDGEKQGFGCLISGTASLAATAAANPSELIMVIAGGTLSPTTPVGMGVAIIGTVFASVCAVGAIATPAVLRTWEYLTWAEPAPAPAANGESPPLPAEEAEKPK